MESIPKFSVGDVLVLKENSNYKKRILHCICVNHVEYCIKDANNDDYPPIWMDERDLIRYYHVPYQTTPKIP